MAGNEIYLGDGLYASFDGYYIMLRAPRAGGDHTVMLEPIVFAALEEQVKKWYADVPKQKANLT
jgi:hypothetical protein